MKAEELLELAREDVDRTHSVAEARATELDRALLSLSGGALGLSIAFANEIASARVHLWLLGLAWVCFGASVGAVVCAMRRAFTVATEAGEDATSNLSVARMALELKDKGGDVTAVNLVRRGPNQNEPTIEPHTATGGVKVVFGGPASPRDRRTAIANFVAVWAFASGAILLAVFALQNLLATK